MSEAASSPPEVSRFDSWRSASTEGSSPSAPGGTPRAAASVSGITLEGQPDHLTADQAATLVKFMAAFESVELPPRWRTDDMLCRFLRARNWDVDLASEMLTSCLAWRRAYQVPGGGSGVDALLRFEFPEREAVQAAMPECYHKTDRWGRPILLQLVGLIDVAAVKAATEWDRLRAFNLHRMEHNIQVKYPVCSKLTGTRVGESLIIIDLKGFRPLMFTSEIREYLKGHFKILQDNYPERMGKMFVINAPMVFAAVWKVLKKFVDPKTANKVEILGSKYKAKLLECIDEKTLPSFLGGLDDTFDKTRDQGPWLGEAGAEVLAATTAAAAAPATDAATAPESVETKPSS